jgi:hypothetical protein
MDDPFDSIFVPIVRDLQDVLDNLVVIGGWVPELHRRFGETEEWSVKPLATTEVDLLLDGSGDIDGAHEAVVETLERVGFSPTGGERASAVWERDVSEGERLEFFLNSTGPWEGLGEVQALEGDQRLGALSLRGLKILQEKSVVFSVPTGLDEAPSSAAQVRVPELAVFLAHKGATFRQRGDLQKRVKDLHYIVDVMQSGDSPADLVERQIANYCAEGGAAAELARQARNLVGLVLEEPSGTALRQGLAEGLSVRHGISVAEGDARARGFLADFVAMIPEGCGGLG